VDKAATYHEPESGNENEDVVLEVRLDGTVAAYSDTAAEKTLALAPLSALVLEALNPRLLGLEDDVDLSLLEAELFRALEGVRQTMSRITVKR
jgi:hypothetical protein